MLKKRMFGGGVHIGAERHDLTIEATLPKPDEAYWEVHVIIPDIADTHFHYPNSQTTGWADGVLESLRVIIATWRKNGRPKLPAGAITIKGEWHGIDDPGF